MPKKVFFHSRLWTDYYAVMGLPNTRSGGNKHRPSRVEQVYNQLYKDNQRVLERKLNPYQAFTLVYDPELQVGAVSVCSFDDRFCKQIGREQSEGRLQWAMDNIGVDAEDSITIFIPRLGTSTFQREGASRVMTDIMKFISRNNPGKDVLIRYTDVGRHGEQLSEPALEA